MTGLETALREYLEQLVLKCKQESSSIRRYCCIEEFMLTHGRFYEPQALPPQFTKGKVTSKLRDRAGRVWVEYSGIAPVMGG